MLFTLRISIPDRPGTLGAVASAFGEGGANILTMDVMETQDGFAVDDFCVEAPNGMHESLKLAAEAVPGLIVEEIRPAGAFRDILAPMELAAVLAENKGKGPVPTLIENLPDALWASWCVAVKPGVKQPEVIAASFGCPDVSEMQTPWFPLEGPRRLPSGGWMPARWRMGMVARAGQGNLELAAAPLSGSESALLLARRTGPAFRTCELRQLGQLARIAAAIDLLTGADEAERHAVSTN